MNRQGRFYKNECDLEDFVLTKKPIAVLESIPVRIRQLLNQCMNHGNNTKGGLYTGSLGVVYVAIKVLSNPVTCEFFNKDEISQIRSYCKSTLLHIERTIGKECSSTSKPTLFFGIPGFHFISILYYHWVDEHMLADEYLKRLSIYLNSIKISEYEMLYGVAGILAIFQELDKIFLQVDNQQQLIISICKYLLNNGKEEVEKLNVKRFPMKLSLAFPFHKTYYIGAAHGCSAILRLLIPHLSLLDETDRTLVHSAVDEILSLQDDNGNFPSSLRETEMKRELVHWCHGAPGVIYMLAAAYIEWGDPKYLEACHKASDCIWERGLLRKGPGLCHGISGNGYAFLLMYRLTGDYKFINKALHFANFMSSTVFDKESRMKPDNPYSLFEGMGGEVCFLCDLLDPQKSYFPFGDIENQN